MPKSTQTIRKRLLVASLPAMPQILVKLIDLCQRDEAGMAQLAKLIAHDAGMTMKILDVANSAAYSRSNNKLDLTQSLNTLGIEMIKTLVINESIFQTFNNFSRSSGVDLRAFWIHALKSAVIARELAKKMSYPHSEEAYIGGLLHDVGRLALLSAAPAEYGANFLAQDDENLCVTESASMGINHAEAGAWLIEQWNLDSFLADSVLYHHESIERIKAAHPLIRIVRLAHLMGSYSSDSLALQEAANLCGIDDADMQTVLNGLNTYTKTAATYFGIDLSETEQMAPSAEFIPQAPARGQAEEKLAEEVKNMALVSAAGKSFAGMSGGKELIESISRSAQILFRLEDVLILLQNADTQVLTGYPVGDHQQRLKELLIPLGDATVIAETVSKRRVTFVVRKDSGLGLVEEQLLRALGSDCMVYMPLMAGQACLGVLVGGLSSAQVEMLWGHERFLKSFATEAAVSLEASASARSEMQKHIASVNELHLDKSRKVIHEVNNPLSIIKNYLGVLDDKVANKEPVSEEIVILNEEIDRVSRIVGGLSDTTPAANEVTEVNGVLQEVVRLFSISRFMPATVNIVVKPSPQPAKIICSSDPVKQILLNLIKNAVEALPKGGKIEVKNSGRVMRDGRAYIELNVSDTGSGIPPDVLANLFSPVRSSKSGANRGLGLNIVQGLVKNHNGFVSCRSGEWGTTFEVLLPARDTAEDGSNAPKQVAKMR